MNCPKCQTLAEADSNFCEECGSQLQAVVAPVPKKKLNLCECGAGPDQIDDDGFCDVCGLQRRKSARDHQEIELCPAMAGVSDLGKRHFQNEDAFGLRQENEFRIAVVCDGVSVSQNPGEASRQAVGAAMESLAASAREAKPEFKAEMREAIAKASIAVQKIPFTPDGEDIDPPSSTLVAAMLFSVSETDAGKRAVIGWLGDSRAYLFTDQSRKLLTRDHSWVNETVDAGELSYEQAIKDKRAHRLTRTLGGCPQDPQTEMDEPGIVEVDLPGAGWLILCTDGLWNYANSADDLGKVFDTIPQPATARDIGEFLTAWANRQGGKDNVTAVAVAV